MKAPIQPVASTKTHDSTRTLLLAALALISAVTLSISGYRLSTSVKQYYVGTFVFAVLFCLLIFMHYGWAKLKNYILSTYTFMTLLILTTVQMLWAYSYRLPGTLLALALIIVITSVVLGARIGLICTGLVSSGVLAIGLLELTGHLQPNLNWLGKEPQLFDAFSYAFILLMIGFAAWQLNRDSEHSLQRALQSEAELRQERDNLEIKVAERSQELEQTKLQRMHELQRFAEFGRMSATLLHELASPLTAASINLEQHTARKSGALLRVQKNLEQVQLYLLSARRQLEGQQNQKRFNVKKELVHISTLLMPMARDANIQIKFKQSGSYWIFGDPVKFNQLVGNLLINAIDASKDNRSEAAKLIMIEIRATKRWIYLSVTDHGNGIEPEDLKHIFEPFFTTKSGENRGLGIGLSLVKAFVEDEFKGTITVHSTSETGTVFSAKLKRTN